jgi:hypothetical protein
MTDTISIVPTSDTANAAPYKLTLDSANCMWQYTLTSPNGTLTRNAGPMTGVDADVLSLYALAVVSGTIPRGVTVNVRTTSTTLAQMGQRLTKPAPIPELPFLPFTADRRSAWEFVLPRLADYTITWKCVARNEGDVLALNAWSLSQR